MKPRQPNRNRGYQASHVDQIERITEANNNNHQSSQSPFNQEQLDHLFKMFSNLQASSQPSSMMSLGSLAHKGNFLIALSTTYKPKIPWIIDFNASDHMTGSYQLFSTYSPCASNVKVKITDGFLSSIARKGNVQLSNSIILESLHVPNLSCNLLSISQLMKDLNY